MDTQYDAYLRGARRLCAETQKDSAEHEAARTFHIRLEENISNIIHGDTRDNKTERSDILNSLNRITERLFNTSFREYCGLDKQQEYLHGKDEGVGRDNSPLPQNITDILILESVKEGNIEPRAQESNLAEQAYDFLITANTYIATLLPCVQNARKAFDNPRLRPQECTDAYTSFKLFSHPCIPSHDPILLEMRVKLLSLNKQIKEITTLFQEFCLEAKKAGKRTSKTQQKLGPRLTTLQADANSTQRFITSILQEKDVLKKNTFLDDIS